MFISIHIPKTAGTTIGYILDYGTKRRIYFDYSEIYDEKELIKDIELVKNHKPFLENKFDVIHGHFRYSKYSGLFPDAKFITCLREPVARTISQFYHVIQEANTGFTHYQKIMEGMDIIEFAKLPNIVHAQQLFCAGRELSEYDFIFISEDLPNSIYKFQKKFSFERNDPYMMLTGEASIPNTNPKSARATRIPSNLLVTNKQKEQLRAVLKEEIDFYNKALEINLKY